MSLPLLASGNSPAIGNADAALGAIFGAEVLPDEQGSAAAFSTQLNALLGGTWTASGSSNRTLEAIADALKTVPDSSKDSHLAGLSVDAGSLASPVASEARTETAPQQLLPEPIAGRVRELVTSIARIAVPDASAPRDVTRLRSSGNGSAVSEFPADDVTVPTQIPAGISGAAEATPDGRPRPGAQDRDENELALISIPMSLQELRQTQQPAEPLPITASPEDTSRLTGDVLANTAQSNARSETFIGRGTGRISDGSQAVNSQPEQLGLNHAITGDLANPPGMQRESEHIAPLASNVPDADGDASPNLVNSNARGAGTTDQTHSQPAPNPARQGEQLTADERTIKDLNGTAAPIPTDTQTRASGQARLASRTGFPASPEAPPTTALEARHATPSTRNPEDAAILPANASASANPSPAVKGTTDAIPSAVVQPAVLHEESRRAPDSSPRNADSLNRSSASHSRSAVGSISLPQQFDQDAPHPPATPSQFNAPIWQAGAILSFTPAMEFNHRTTLDPFSFDEKNADELKNANSPARGIAMTAPGPVLPASPGDVGSLNALNGAGFADRLSTDLASLVAMTSTPGRETYHLRLDPPELGKLKIDITRTENGELSIRIEAAHPQTHHLLNQHAQEMTQTLNHQGVSVTSFDFSDGGQSAQHRSPAPFEEQAEAMAGRPPQAATVSQPQATGAESSSITFRA